MLECGQHAGRKPQTQTLLPANFSLRLGPPRITTLSARTHVPWRGVWLSLRAWCGMAGIKVKTLELEFLP